MKIAIDRMNLLRPLGHVSSVVERRNTIPILANIVLRAESSKLSLTATDMDMDIMTELDCSVIQEGSCTVPAHLLNDIIRKLPDGSEVSIHVSDGNAQISAGRSSFKVPTLPVDDFPAFNTSDLPVKFILTTADLRHQIDMTRFAISTEETRYYLNGIYLHKAERDGINVLRAVATDGHRLANVESPLPAGAEDMPGVIVPRKAVTELRKLIDESGDEVRVSLSETKIRFAFDDAVLTSKLIDGTFPDYERVIPVGNDKTMEVDCKPFADAVDRVSAISSEKSRAVKLALTNGLLVLTASSPEHGSATEEVEVDYQGDDIEIGFNSAYLIDITRQIEGDKARFSMADSASPTIVREVDDDSALYVLMPMRV